MTKKSNRSKKSEKRKKKPTFTEWRKKHHKGLMITYYTVAAIIIIINIGIILSHLTINETVEREETISYFTEYIDDENLELWEETVEQEGIDGIKIVLYDERKRLLSGELLDSNPISERTEKEPQKKIIKRGTRKWQYMYCQDSTYMYYTDEQFQDKYTGFTHSSEDQCAANGHGSMTTLADKPPTNYGYSNSTYGASADSSYTPVYADLSTLDQIRDFSEYDLPVSESDDDNTDYHASAELYAKQAYRYAVDACAGKASSASKSLRGQLGVLGQPAEQVDREVSNLFNSTYQSCMRSYGY